MPIEQAEGFSDNWAYLKAELGWLERVLMLAVARQRKEMKEVDRLAQSKADRATSHWWKGIISLEGSIVHDELRKNAPVASKQTYQQQIEARIQVTQEQGILLGVPMLCDRLNLTPFEKNLILLLLAPEVNRRYAKIYRYLQGEEGSVKTDLPTVDLVLRLLCRNDTEWRIARTRLQSDSPLVQYHLLHRIAQHDDTFLNYPLRLSDSIVDFLLAEQPNVQTLDAVLNPIALKPSFLTHFTDPIAWTELVLPPPLLTSLQALPLGIQWRSQLEDWHFHSTSGSGTIALFTGAPGTGKTIAAKAIAHQVSCPLTIVDLAGIPPAQYPDLLQELAIEAPTVLLIKSADLWLKRSALLSKPEVQQFLNQRRTLPTLTLFSVTMLPSVQLYWRRQLDRILTFALPGERDRLLLWKRSFPSQIPLASKIDWQFLAKLSLTGKEIGSIARQAALLFAESGNTKLGMIHILQAIELRNIPIKHF